MIAQPVLTRIICLLTFILVLSAGFAWFSISLVPIPLALAALAIIWTSLISVLYFAASEGDQRTIPFFPIIGLFYATFFGLPSFLIPLAWPDADSIVIFNRISVGTIRLSVLLWVLGAVAVMVAGFYFGRLYLFRRIPKFTLPSDVTIQQAHPLFWVLAAAHFAFEYIPSISGIPSIGQFLSPAIYVALGGFYLLWVRGELPTPSAVLVMTVVVPLEIYARIRYMFITHIIFFALFFGILYWRTGRVRQMLAFCAIILIVLSAYGARAPFRSGDTGLRLELIAQAYWNFLNGKDLKIGDIRAPYRMFEVLTERISHIWVLHVVDERSPDPVPYWNGETYKPLLTSLIPRAIYPEKPPEITGGEFGRRYGFLLPDQFETSFNLPWITELLANFGHAGLLLGMTAVGLFLALLDKIFNEPGSQDLEFLIGLTVILPLVYPESNFTLMVGSLLPLFVSLYIFVVVGVRILRKLSK